MTAQVEAHIAPLHETDINELIALARDIWYRHYPDMITVDQIEYMLAQRYHPAAIRAQLASASAWRDKLIMDGTMVGFASCERSEHPDEMKLDKVYVSYDLRGRGLGSLLTRNAEARARML